MWCDPLPYFGDELDPRGQHNEVGVFDPLHHVECPLVHGTHLACLVDGDLPMSDADDTSGESLVAHGKSQRPADQSGADNYHALE